jgi:dihydrofolate synthase/folylpolyglutamate synthase
VTIGETSPCEILLDGAHNPAGVRALVDYLADLPGPRCDLLFGALCDKRAEQSLGLLAPLVGRITLTRPASERALSPRELATQAGLPGLAVVDEPRKALWSALRQCPTESPADVPAEGPARLLVCGSLYLLGEIRQELRRCYGQPAPAVEIATSSASSAAL